MERYEIDNRARNAIMVLAAFLAYVGTSFLDGEITIEGSTASVTSDPAGFWSVLIIYLTGWVMLAVWWSYTERKPRPFSIVRRCIKLIAMALLVLVAVAYGVYDLSDGELSGRRIGQASVDHNPVKFWIYATLFGLGAPVLAVFAWLTVIDEWKQDYRPFLKPPIDDPSKRSEP